MTKMLTMALVCATALSVVPAGALVATAAYAAEQTQVVTPADGAQVSGTAVRVEVRASDFADGNPPSLFLDGVLIKERLDSQSGDGGYVYLLDSSVLSNGLHELRAGDTAEAPNSAPVRIDVQNVSPTVRVTSPAAGSVVFGTIPLAADATADSSVSASVHRVAFYAGTDLVATDFTAPYTVQYETFGDGPLRITATAYDSQGLSGSASVDVTVQNHQATTIVHPTDGARVSGAAVRVEIQRSNYADELDGPPSLFLDGVFLTQEGVQGDVSGRYVYSLNTLELGNGLHELRAGRSPEEPTSAAIHVDVQNMDVALSLSPGTISAGERVTVTYRGAPNASVEILSRTQPATAFSKIGTVTLDSSGLGTSSHLPQKNTRMAARVTGATTGASQPLIQVKSVASFSAHRVGFRTYTFTGRVYPALSNRLVNIYRNGSLVAQARSDATGIYKVTRTLGAGTFTFQAKSPNDTYNLGAISPLRQVSIY